MKYIIKEGRFKRSKTMLIVTGSFLIILFSYQLYSYLQTHQFVSEFPGDWDKPLGIAIGLFLIIRSRKFIVKSRDLFVEIDSDQLTYRVNRLSSVNKIPLSNIDKIQEKRDRIILTTKDSTTLTIVDFSKCLIRDDKRNAIKTSLTRLSN